MVDHITHTILLVLTTSFFMVWDVFWPLILGFLLSALIQTLVSHQTITNSLGKDSNKNVLFATLFGIASSSCSYAAVAIARSLFQKSASFTNAMIFQLASTNLVLELGIVLFVLMGWEFALAEWVGGVIMILLIVVVFRLTFNKHLVYSAQKNAQQNLQGKMEGHAAMDMSIKGNRSIWSKLFSGQGFTAISHYFVMDIVSIWSDLVIGFFIAGLLTVLVPVSFWEAFFFIKNPTLHFLIGPLIGPFISILSFVCSIGNVPLALLLWNSGLSFGGVISFLFADLLVLPILDIYRKYYGWKVAGYLLLVFYSTMSLSGYLVEIAFNVISITPQSRHISIYANGNFLPYTDILNGIFLIFACLILIRFVTTGGIEMIKMMSVPSHHHA